MWVFQNKSFVSVVAHRTQKDRLLVRSRVEGDIQRAVPVAQVFEDLNADYRYRAVVTRAQFKKAMNDAVDRIDYANFKGSIGIKKKEDRDRHDAYMGVWSVMASWYGAYVGRRTSALFDESDYGPETGEDADVSAYLEGERYDELPRVGDIFPGWERPKR